MIPFQSHQTHRLSWPLIGLGDRLGWLTALGPRSFLPVVLVCDPFYIVIASAKNRRHQFGTKGSFASIRMHLYIKLLLETSLMQMVPNGFLANLQFVGNGKVLACRSDTTISLILSTFSTIGLPESGASLTSKLPERK